jgi:predicted methyltransferase
LSWVVLCVVGGAFAAGAQSDPNSEVANRIRAAIAAEHRTPADTARDANRKPLETLLFFGVREDLHVLELVPAGGWFTKILAPVLKDDGKLYVALGPLDDVRDLREQHAALAAVEVLDTARDIAFRAPPDMAAVRDTSFGVTDLDMVVTFRNLHNYTRRCGPC